MLNSKIGFAAPPHIKKTPICFRSWTNPQRLLQVVTLLMFSFFLFNPNQSFGQCAQWLSNYRVDVVTKMPGSAIAGLNCGPVACDEIIYEFWLRANTSQVLIPEFRYTAFQVSGKVPPNGNAVFIDVKQSMDMCSPQYDASQFSIDPDGRFALNLGNILNDDYQSNTDQNAISLDNTGSALLFSIVVHAAPGETITITDDTPQNPSPYLFVFGRKNEFTPQCLGYFGVTFNGASNPTVTMPSAATCSNGSSYKINAPATQNIQATQNGIFNAVNIPILLNGLAAGPVDEIVAKFEIKTANYMEFGNITSDIFPACSGPDCPLLIQDRIENNFKIRTITAKITDLNFDPTKNLLLNVVLWGPINKAIADCAEVSVKYVRTKINGSCCILPKDANGLDNVTVCYLGYNTCADYILNFTELSTNSDNCRVGYRVSLDWTGSQSTLNFQNLNFTIQFRSDLPGTAFENITMGTSSNITFVQNQTFSDIWEVKFNASNLSIQKNAGFDIIFDGINGCVTSYLFTWSVIKPLGASTFCVPAIPNPYALGAYSRCATKLAGTVSYKYTGECDTYFLTATSNTNSSQCNFVKSLSNNAQVYSFCVCDKEFPYTTRFTKAVNGNYLGNVSTYDCLLISKHILGIQDLGDPFKYVAADANCSGAISNFDITKIRQLILGISNDFGLVDPNSPPSPTNPLIPSYKLFNFAPTATNFTVTTGEVNALVSSATASNNYYVVKTGDVSWDAATSPWNCLVGGNPDDRNQQVIDLSIPCLIVQRGQNVVVPIILNNDVTVSALQFELSFNSKQLRYNGFESGDLLSIDQESIGDFNVEDGKWRLGWFDPKGAYTKLPSNTILGYLKFTALDDNFTDCIKLSYDENALPGLLFDANGNESTLRLINTTVGHQSILVKVNPNPFIGDTQVNVELSKGEKGVIPI